MNNLKIKIKKIYPDAILPQYALNGDAGMDLFSREEIVLKAGERYTFSTGIALELPAGYVSLIWDKSGLSSKFGLKVLGGVLDSNYRGEYMICLVNTGSEDYHFKVGDKIAQLLIQPVMQVELELVDELSDSVRGEGRHGSTGQ